VGWRDGIGRAIEAHFPGAFSGDLEVKPEVEKNIWGQK
jgi:hypothetical protein